MRHDKLFAASRARRLLEEYNLTGSVLVIGCAEGYPSNQAESRSPRTYS